MLVCEAEQGMRRGAAVAHDLKPRGSNVDIVMEKSASVNNKCYYSYLFIINVIFLCYKLL